jgi:glycosyltransferase involved in cell wall biosynthesis
MVVFSHYPDDPRVRREAEALVRAGWLVDVLCLRKEGQPATETVNGVGVVRLPVARRRGSPLRYLWEYGLFGLLALLRLAWMQTGRRYRVVHIHNMPDVLVAAALVPRLAGARVVLDLHDPMPEVFMAKYGLPAEHRLISLLRRLEAWSVRRAHLVLTPNIAFRELFIGRGCPAERIRVIMNSPDPSIFAASPPVPRAPDAPLVLMYHGTVVERHGLGTALQAMALVRREVADVRFEVYGEGDYVEAFLARRAELGLEDVVRYHGFVSLETIAAAIRDADVGVIPNLRTVFTEINLPTRIFEYLSLGKQVIAPATRGISDYFPSGSLHVFEPGDAGSLARAILDIRRDPIRAAEVLREGLAVYGRHAWPGEADRLVRLYSHLGKGHTTGLPV